MPGGGGAEVAEGPALSEITISWKYILKDSINLFLRNISLAYFYSGEYRAKETKPSGFSCLNNQGPWVNEIAEQGWRQQNAAVQQLWAMGGELRAAHPRHPAWLLWEKPCSLLLLHLSSLPAFFFSDFSLIDRCDPTLGAGKRKELSTQISPPLTQKGVDLVPKSKFVFRWLHLKVPPAQPRMGEILLVSDNFQIV